MPTGADAPDLLLDTSAAVALLVSDHEHHGAVIDAVGNRRLGLAGHALFETFSVLTRVPPPTRRAPAAVVELLAANFVATRHLSAREAGRLLPRLAELGLGGGSVYDALVGASAAEHGISLGTRDRRALDTYRAVGATVEVLG